MSHGTDIPSALGRPEDRKGKAPSESNVSTRDIRHQAQSNSASMFNRTRQGSTYLGTETKRWILASTSGCSFLLLPPRAWLKSWHRSQWPQFHAATVWAQDNESRDRLPVGTPMSLTPLQGSGHSQRSNSGGATRPTASGRALGPSRKSEDIFVSNNVHTFRGTGHVQRGNSGSTYSMWWWRRQS